MAAELLLQSVGSNAVLIKGDHVISTMHDVLIISKRKPDIQIIKHGLYGENMEILLAGHEDYSEYELVVDILNQASGEKTLFVRPRINSSSTHGSGCTLSSAIACEIALGCNCVYDTKHSNPFLQCEAVKKAIAQPLGKGPGPLDHFHSVTPLLIPR